MSAKSSLSWARCRCTTTASPRLQLKTSIFPPQLQLIADDWVEPTHDSVANYTFQPPAPSRNDTTDGFFQTFRIGVFYTSHVTHHTSHVTHHTSHITRHTSHITPHTSHITLHASQIDRRTHLLASHRWAAFVRKSSLRRLRTGAAMTAKAAAPAHITVISGLPSTAKSHRL